MKPENRDRIRDDERVPLDQVVAHPAQRDGVLARDVDALLDKGGNTFLLTGFQHHRC